MNRRRLLIAIYAAVALMALVVAVTVFVGKPRTPVTAVSIPSSNRHEVASTGLTHSPRIPAEAWAEADLRTRRLHPEAFSDVPPSIKEVLVRRGCTIPQTYGNENPHNIISGRFTSPTHVDWAVLCSRDRISSILVFTVGDPAPPVELDPSPDVNYLQGLGGAAIGFSRAINVASPQSIRAHYQAYGGPIPPALDHEGIDDAFIGKGSTVFFWHSGRWLELTGSD